MNTTNAYPCEDKSRVGVEASRVYPSQVSFEEPWCIIIIIIIIMDKWMIFDKVIHRWLCHDSLGRVIEPLAIYSKERNGYPISDLLKNLLHLRFYKRKIRHKTFLKERETAAAFFFFENEIAKKRKTNAIWMWCYPPLSWAVCSWV